MIPTLLGSNHATLPEGVGLGAVLVKAKTIKDEMFIAAARALADYGGWCSDWNMHLLLAAADHAALPVCALTIVWRFAGNKMVSGARTAADEAANRVGPWHLLVCVMPALILFLAALQSASW